MLYLKHGRLGLFVFPILEAIFVVVLLDVIDAQAFAPREGQHFVVALEVVLDVALGADIGAHLLAGRLAQVYPARFHRVPECGTGDPELHRLRVVAVSA